MTDHSDLIERLRKLKVWDDHPSNQSLGDEAASALSSQSLSLSEAREEIERHARNYNELRETYDLAAADRVRLRDALAALVLNIDAGGATLDAMSDARSALENGPAGLADAHTNPPLSDLSSLRKGAEELRRSLICVKQQCETAVFNISQREHDDAVVRSFQSIADYCARALVSGSREDGDDA